MDVFFGGYFRYCYLGNRFAHFFLVSGLSLWIFFYGILIVENIDLLFNTPERGDGFVNLEC